jgi:hypothetical protein
VTARILPLQRGREIRAERYALAKAETVRSLAEELLAIRGINGATDDEARHVMAAWWVNQGWAQQDDVRLAFETLERCDDR